MDRRRLVQDVIERHFSTFRKSQRTTITCLVAGLLCARRVGHAAIARAMRDSTTVRHRIKRLWRFVTNERIRHQEATRALVAWMLGSPRQQVHPALIALDWTVMGDYWMLAAKLVVGKRAVPVAWKVVTVPEFSGRHRSKNQVEEDLIVRLAAALGTRRWILLADRGFARADLLSKLNGMGIDYVIRVCAGTWVQTRSHSGLLGNIARKPSRAVRYGGVLYQKRRRVPINLVVTHAEPAPEPWYLATNTEAGAREVARLYARRMAVEQGFRDAKTGLGLKHLWLASSERMERMMVLVAITMALSVLAGAHWRRRNPGRDPQMTTKRKGGEISIFRLGLELLRLTTIPPHLPHALIQGGSCHHE